MIKHRSHGLGAVLLVVLTACLNACDRITGPASPQLRVVNVGSRPVEGLVILFPGDRVEFGNVAPGMTTPYRVAGGGVFRYAAFEFRVEGRMQSQPVVDWVGEEPMDGRAFTYSLELVSGPSSRVIVRLVGTQRDY